MKKMMPYLAFAVILFVAWAVRVLQPTFKQNLSVNAVLEIDFPEYVSRIAEVRTEEEQYSHPCQRHVLRRIAQSVYQRAFISAHVAVSFP